MKLRYCSAAFLTGIITSPLLAGFGFGADINYISMTQTSTAIGHADTISTYSGNIVSPYFRLYAPLGDSVTIGIGPCIGFGSLKPNSLSTNLNYETISVLRFGGDIILNLNLTPYAQPFVRLMLGKDLVEDTGSIKTAPKETVLVVEYGGLYWCALAGLKMPVTKLLSLYVQGGVSGSPNSSATVNSGTGPGATAASISTLNAQNTQISYTGFLLGAGVVMEF